jgi:peptidoglycan/xylan/chitin deacetylase (PgdA/CDA1 family)
VRPYLIRPPKAYRWLFTDAWFRLENEESKTVYLTFDDGPHPKATPFVLNVLKKHGIKATFFMLGKNAVEYPEIVDRIRQEGHTIGNHGMNHLNGWVTSETDYLNDVKSAERIVDSSLFRPPYGKLGYRQYNQLKTEYQVVFWDVISGDFDTAIDGKNVVKNVIENVREGSIVVMHDSAKAFPNLKDSLETIIVELSSQGFSFGALTLN